MTKRYKHSKTILIKRPLSNLTNLRVYMLVMFASDNKTNKKIIEV